MTPTPDQILSAAQTYRACAAERRANARSIMESARFVRDTLVRTPLS